MIYTDGTIAIKAGSPIVTGTGTQWKKNIHGVAPGQLISIENGATPVSMMIRAVNSDTELVLAFNAPVTLSGAKYSIATTVPDTISDAARTMSANQGYIVYFLQAMQQWMTDTGQVEIELPNGQKVTLDSIKALNEAIKKIDEKVDNIKIPEPKDATTTQKGIVQLSASVGASTTKVPHEKAVSEWVRNTETYRSTLLPYNAPAGEPNDLNDKLARQTHFDYRNLDYNYTRSFAAYPPGVSCGISTRDKVWGGTDNTVIGMATFRGWPDVSGNRSNFQLLTQSGHLYFRSGNVNLATMSNAWTVWTESNTAVDGNGFIKRASPVIQIHPDGNYKTNDESEGAEVLCTGTGQYHITGILGYNADGAWGVNGGISVPKDNNGLELVYVDDRVQEDGSLIIETCHRQHAHLPERFQNWRLKDITPEGERIFYQDGEPCDLPESTRLDVRVEMPQGSVWNVKQRELAEQMEREAQEAAEQGVDSDQ